MREALASGRALDERWHLRRDGSRFWGEGLLLPLRGGAAGEQWQDGAKARLPEDPARPHGAAARRGAASAAAGRTEPPGEEHARARAGDRRSNLARGRQATTTPNRSTAPARRFHQGLRARLRALARAHDLLFRDDWDRRFPRRRRGRRCRGARGRARAAPTARRQHRRSALPARRCGWRPKPRWRWRWPSTSWRPTPPSTAPCPCQAAGWRWSGGRRRTADAGDHLDGGGRAADRLAAEAARLRFGPPGARPRAPAQRRGHHPISPRRPALP